VACVVAAVLAPAAVLVAAPLVGVVDACVTGTITNATGAAAEEAATLVGCDAAAVALPLGATCTGSVAAGNPTRPGPQFCVSVEHAGVGYASCLGAKIRLKKPFRLGGAYGPAPQPGGTGPSWLVGYG
jgi:hypothetical protein